MSMAFDSSPKAMLHKRIDELSFEEATKLLVQIQKPIEAIDEAVVCLRRSVTEALELSMRADRALREANILTVGVLVQLAKDQLMKKKILGRKSIKDMEEQLREMYGLFFGTKLSAELQKEFPLPEAFQTT